MTDETRHIERQTISCDDPPSTENEKATGRDHVYRQAVRGTLMKQRLSKVLCHPALGQIIGFMFRQKLPHHGCIVDTSQAVVRPQVKAQIFWGIYESAETRFTRKYMIHSLDVVELGASLGVVTSHIAQIIRDDRRVISVEANPELIRTIKRNLRANKVESRVTVINRVVVPDDCDEDQVMFHVSSDTLGSSLNRADGAVRHHRVPAVSLSRLLQEFQVCDYVLVSDVEGAEASFICDGRGALQSCKQLIIELHDTVVDGQAVGIQRMCQELETTHGFVAVVSRGGVFVYNRPDSG